MAAEIPTRRHFGGIEISEIPEFGRQFSTFGHFRAIDQYGQDRYLSFQCRLDLDSDRIRLFLDSESAVSIGAKPLRADNCNEDVGTLQRFADVTAKISTERDIIVLSTSIKIECSP
jgi:hypothetical protein